MLESSTALLTIPDIVSSLDSARVFILSFFLVLELKIFWVMRLVAAPDPRIILTAPRGIPTGKPTTVAEVVIIAAPALVAKAVVV